MNTEFTSQWLIPTTTNLIAAILIWLIGKALSRMKISMSTVKGVASNTTKRMLPAVVNIALYVLVFWFFVWQLRTLCEPSGPPSRTDAFLISFWTFWLVWFWTELLSGKPFLGAPLPKK